MSPTRRPATDTSTQSKARSVRPNCLAVITSAHALNLAMRVARPAARADGMVNLSALPITTRAHFEATPIRLEEVFSLSSPRYVFSVLAAPVAQTCSLLYRRFLTCDLPPASNVLPITNRRYGRLKICATVNRYFAGGR